MTFTCPTCRPCAEPATVPHYDSDSHRIQAEILEKLHREDMEALKRAESGLCIWPRDEGGECGAKAEDGLIYCRPHVRRSKREYGDEDGPPTIESERVEIERIRRSTLADLEREAQVRREQAGASS
ncbi:MAG TPA: hypothetical protein VFM55_18980 [Micromonosporaceae bacterium]|nr:hypothetical protein [Micromonosporaceae bacterium]